ncbi:MAG: ATPase with role in protein import into the ER [Marteilia pararefringens]
MCQVANKQDATEKFDSKPDESSKEGKQFVQKFACGIDLGTTNTLCFVRFPGTVAATAVSNTTEKFTPSVVVYESDRHLVGIPALNMMGSGKPGIQSVAMAKLLMGKVCKEIDAAERAALATLFTCELDYGLPESSPRFVIIQQDKTKKLVRPEEISALILQKVHKDICSVANIPEDTKIEITLTVPARFSSKAKIATDHAAQIANFSVHRLVTEPIAATLAAVQGGFVKCPVEGQDAKFIMVFDVGGGTTDVVLVNLCEDNVVEMVLPDGDTMLGGRNATMAISERFLTKFCSDYGFEKKDIQKDSRAMSKLWIESEEAKKRIQSKDPMGYEVEIFNFYGGKDLIYNYRYKEFETDFRPMSDKLMNIVHRLLKEAGKTAADLDYVILMGGSCRLKPIQERIIQLVGTRKVISSVDFDTAIAQGACVVSELVKGQGLAEGEKGEDMVLLDVCPSSFRIETKGEMAPVIIARGSPYPTSHTMPFTTASEQQDTVEVVILEGESDVAPFNKRIGSFMMHGVRSTNGQRPEINVTAKLDVNGLLHISAVDKHTKQEKNITIDSSTMTKEERDKFMQEQKDNAEKEKQIKALIVVKNEIVNMAEEIKSGCEKIKQDVPSIVDDIYRSVVDLKANNILAMTSEEKLNEQKEKLNTDPGVQQLLQQIQQANYAGADPAAAAAAAAGASGPTVDEAD